MGIPRGRSDLSASGGRRTLLPCRALRRTPDLGGARARGGPPVSGDPAHADGGRPHGCVLARRGVELHLGRRVLPPVALRPRAPAARSGGADQLSGGRRRSAAPLPPVAPPGPARRPAW